jgi:hypothetical protein
MSWIAIVIVIVLAQPSLRLFERTMTKSNFDDPVYKKNLRRLIERNRRFEETRE